MTLPSNIRINVGAPFPSTVQASGGLKISKANGIWTIEPDFSALSAIVASALTDPTSKQIWIYDPTYGNYNVLTLAGLGDALYKMTSTTSLAVGLGSKTFTTQMGKDLVAGSWVLATDDADPSTNWMAGQVTSYSGATLVVEMLACGGSGTYTDWTIRVSGSTGGAGAGYAATSTTSLATAGSGSKAFTTQAGLAYSAGARVRATSVGTGEWMEGVVSSYSGTTLTVTMDLNNGTGTHADWNLNLAGQQGTAGSGTISGATANGIGIATAPGAMTSTAALTDGQIPIGQTGSAPLPKSISGLFTLAANGVATCANTVITYANMVAAAIAGAGDFIGNTASKLLTAAAVWADAAPAAIADAATYTPNFSTASNFTITLGATCGATGTLANPAGTVKPGQTGVIAFVQDGTGSRKIASWGTQYKFPGGTKPTFSTAAAAVDSMSYWCKSATEIHCGFNQGWS